MWFTALLWLPSKFQRIDIHLWFFHFRDVENYDGIDYWLKIVWASKCQMPPMSWIHVCVFPQRCPREVQAQSPVTNRQTAWRRTTAVRRMRSGSLRSDLSRNQHYTYIEFVRVKQTNEWHDLTIGDITPGVWLLWSHSLLCCFGKNNYWEFDCDWSTLLIFYHGSHFMLLLFYNTWLHKKM